MLTIFSSADENTKEVLFLSHINVFDYSHTQNCVTRFMPTSSLPKSLSAVMNIYLLDLGNIRNTIFERLNSEYF